MTTFNSTDAYGAQEADAVVPPVLRLVVTPEARPGRFTARLESGEVIVTDTGQPAADGARELITRGFPAGLLLTVRHARAGSDSFRPLSVSVWASWTFTEGETTPLRRQAWKPRQMPIAAVTEGQNSTSAGLAAVGKHIAEFASAGRRNRATAGDGVADQKRAP